MIYDTPEKPDNANPYLDPVRVFRGAAQGLDIAKGPPAPKRSGGSSRMRDELLQQLMMQHQAPGIQIAGRIPLLRP